MNRRQFTAALAALPAWSAHGVAASGTGTLVMAQASEPQSLTNALSTEGNIYAISSKLFDGLLSFGADGKPQPRLATHWEQSADGLRLTLKLRPGVRWHDGKPFGAADVAWSVDEVWKKYNARGRTTFATVERVDVPDPLTAVLRLSKPAPYLLSALSSIESQVLPRHLYEGSNPLLNPRNAAPIGNGPFRFVSRQRGSQIVLERNPDYWDAGRPQISRLVFRTVPDAASVAAALETGEVQLGAVALADVARLKANPALQVTEIDEPYTCSVNALEFNLDRPVFRDPRVRQAFAHAIDRGFILKNIYHGHGAVADSPIPPALREFYSRDVPLYAFDPARADALLDAAGLPRNAQGTRLTLKLDPTPAAESVQVAQYIRSALARVGVKLEVRNQDFAEFVNRIYTRRDFDTAVIGGNSGPDPAIGTQRWYWSRNYQPGVAFSNGTHYASAEMDRALEGAQTELDPARRRQLYLQFQRLAQTDLPRIPLIAATRVVVSNRRLRNFINSAEGLYGNFADATIQPA
ncbi:ABC transporter substrate-binding protein [Paucibacter sp. R3-3]|uniref:ABC transporter substrate-binding protein n=1 Tax=Roseateles agri TaxID=3098619 RepID=A0ABU5DPN1_9BURK|nr:ABC transporter substrate-binding protein [Paucibacter sp. R3-3]MDY0747676.1 ABC transporter substrate-binding protein [Paucibacter sp. R3-3]